MPNHDDRGMLGNDFARQIGGAAKELKAVKVGNDHGRGSMSPDIALSFLTSVKKRLGECQLASVRLEDEEISEAVKSAQKLINDLHRLLEDFKEEFDAKYEAADVALGDVKDAIYQLYPIKKP